MTSNSKSEYSTEKKEFIDEFESVWLDLGKTERETIFALLEANEPMSSHAIWQEIVAGYRVFEKKGKPSLNKILYALERLEKQKIVKSIKEIEHKTRKSKGLNQRLKYSLTSEFFINYKKAKAIFYEKINAKILSYDAVTPLERQIYRYGA